MKRDAVIFDIDGTLADNRHRQNFLLESPKNWDAFFAGMEQDTPRPMVKSLVWMYEDRGFEVILVTGRYEKYGTFTTNWLTEHGIAFHHLHMRPDSDSRPDYEVKRGIYETQIAPHFNVKLVVDDRSSVVKMWRELGLECWQVDEGNF